MWNQGEYVTLLLQPTSLFLCWFNQSKDKAFVFVPHAWHIEPLDCLQVEQGTIYNPTFLAQIIAQFLATHSIKNPIICIGLNQKMVWERCVWIENEHPTSDEIAHEARSLIWNYTYLGKNQSYQKHLFYLFGIAREILFQYQLLALQVPFTCSTITTATRALMHTTSCVQQLDHFNFSTVELSEITQHCIQFFDAYNAEQLFETSSSKFFELFQKEKSMLLASIGLFLLGKSYELQ